MTIVLVGAGGLGCPAAWAIAPAAVERGLRLRFIDDDKVDLSNLHRQILHRAVDVGRSKVDSARDALLRRWPALIVEAVEARLDAENAHALLAGAGVVVDGTDSIDAKFVLNDACRALGLELVHGGVVGWTGQMMTIVDGSACYRCLFEAPPEVAPPSCEQAGIVGPAAGVLGVEMGAEALRVLDGKPLHAGGMTIFDFQRDERRVARIRPRPGCPACGARSGQGPNSGREAENIMTSGKEATPC